MLYVGAEQFTTDYAEAARDRSFGRFRKKYRDVDLLMVDDIQFIGGKRQTQEGFFHIFNHLHETNRQVVVAGDRHPGEMEELDRRLVSRFEGGLLADITQPGLETRVEILRSKCSSMSVEALVGISDLPEAGTTADEIIKSTAAYFGLSIQEVTSKRRLKRYVQARDIAMYLLKEELNLSPMRIGALFADRTPAGVSAACRKVSERLRASKSVQVDISRIQDSLFSGIRA